MSAKDSKPWRREFGIEDRKPPTFFSDETELSASTPQGHVVRRAFQLLGLDGVLCGPTSPLIYFKQVQSIEPELVFHLHRKFWNHGGAPVLVLVSPAHVHIYSGMAMPAKVIESQPSAGLVKTLGRVAPVLKEFLVSVESGDFFGQNIKCFNPEHRVDRSLLSNLTATREILEEITKREIAPNVLDALLCRLVFTCYLFDRGVIGQNYVSRVGSSRVSHLRDILAVQPTSEAKGALYRLFKKLGRDFNGDLFSDDLDAEARCITNKHIQTLSDFFHGTLVQSGQTSFWPYDFSAIPIETISAIYEHFLKSDEKQAGAFYTPRFLAEITLDSALEEAAPLLGKRFLDPACGSGIFLVGLFNRLAEEWKRSNPNARNDRRARELTKLLCNNIHGVDINPTACRITAFSLYLAFLDQLEPRDIQELQKRGGVLPPLVVPPNRARRIPSKGSIYCADFFELHDAALTGVDLVIGNPPWGSMASDATAAGKWCSDNRVPLPDKQIAAAFMWKAAQHIADSGKVSLVLPHGTFFNHGATAVSFQKAWLARHRVQRILNLADLRWFLFEKAVHPALVVSYDRAPKKGNELIEYWSPKGDWSSTQAEVVNVSALDRTSIPVRDLLKDLEGEDAPQLLKQRFWGTPRDIRLLERLFLYPRLRDHVRSSRDSESTKPLLIAEGFQPVGINDDETKAVKIKLPSKYFIEATSPAIDLFLLTEDCDVLSSATTTVRSRSNKNTKIFEAPHVLITKGFERIAFADFDVSFRHALRGLQGSKEHRNLLAFIAAYLRTPLAKYCMFHTSSSHGMYRPEVHVEEVLRLPLPLPHQQKNEKRCKKIVDEVAAIVMSSAERATGNFLGRSSVVEEASKKIEQLIDEYFDIHPLEKILIKDTIDIVIPSIQPRRTRMPVPTVRYASQQQRDSYKNRLCEMLNGWSKSGAYVVQGTTIASSTLGTGVMVLEKVSRSRVAPMQPLASDVLESLSIVQGIAKRSAGTIDVLRGVMVFDANRLYVVKPLGQRHWSQTAALNDADEIAGTILMLGAQDSA